MGGRALRTPSLTVALLPGGDRFEDFFDKIGVSLDTFRERFTGGWLFNYISALELAGVRTVLFFTSARVTAPLRFIHIPSGAPVWVLPSPRLHRKLRNASHRYPAHSATLAAAASYTAMPVRHFARALRQDGCSVILCQEYESARFDVCVLLGKLLGRRVYATYQGGNRTGTSWERACRRRSMSACAGLIVPSRVEVSRLEATYGVSPRKISGIPNPVDVSIPLSDRHAVRTALGIAAGTRVVAWHGRVQIPKKGLDVLLDAWDGICADRPHDDILLLLVGDGRDADALRRRIGQSQRVRWIDRYVLDRAELWDLLSAADVYVIPSRYEGFAVAVLEAMACGLPVVASDAEGVADALPGGEEDGGIIVPSENAKALAAALLRLLDQPEAARHLGELARHRMEAEFSLSVIGRRLRQFLFPESGPQ
jgi:glycosyltransferase involved in cell wall biosynthesis